MIELKGLTKKYEGKTIFENLNIVFPEKKLNFILGKNGIGKTTLYKCILNLENYSGEIVNNNERIFCIFDEQPFYTNLSGFQNIDLFKSLYSIKTETLIDCSMMDTSFLKKKVKNYSYGQKKKLALLLVDIICPDVLLLDEASNGLDYETIKYLKQKLEIWKNGMTIIITGHQLDFYNSIIDNTFVMLDGKIVSVNKGDKKLEEIYDEYIK
ncbi:MAG: ATP-binding cassette domain-containing protein [Erysipelotrichaceae bacterium]